ncbi:MAG: hybrid sensor histidine kinase/response regulator [Pseudomonadota bacterium]|nr:hybrid sensor histidine kinase/response regulator [Pseudomonadota bacterium]
MMIQEDERLFQDDDVLVQEDIIEPPNERWKVMIIDDEEDVHQITHFVLEDYVYQGKRIELISAYSSEEAKQLYRQHANTALMLLDVVMETNDAGLQFIKYIREIEKNRFVRIVLRTGQPGYAPEKEVILKYDINDYRNKTELTDQRLFTVMTASLRAYADIMTIEAYRQHLEAKVAQRTQELEAKNQQLMQLNQDKNEFLSIAAHDLKNPLATIQTLANMIKTSLHQLTQEQLIRFAHLIEISSEKMFLLIKNLLDVNAIESGHIHLSAELFDLCHLVHTLVEDYRERAQVKNITLHVHCVEGKYPVFADPVATTQALENILSNSIKFSPPGKQVYIRLKRDQQMIRCEIEDQGPGLSTADQAKLFGKFSRLTPRPTHHEHSTGLGLFIVKRLVEAMRGQIWCQSELGQGCVFIVSLPTEV